LKNELCRKGILALNIGVIDPCFEGPISSTLINFGRQDFVVKQGASFLRISFHRCPPSLKGGKSKRYNREQYISQVKGEVAEFMAPTFLNIDKTAKRAAKRAFGSFKRALTLWAIVAGVLLALIAILAPLGASYVDKYVVAREQRELQLEQTVVKKLEERYETRLKALADQVEELKRTTADKAGHGNISAGKP